MAQSSRLPSRSRFTRAPSRRVFVDSGAYLAVLDRDDEHHDEAGSILQFLVTNRYRQHTTNAVLFEAHALILSRLGIEAAGRFIRTLRQSGTHIERVSPADEERAEAILHRYSDKDFSFTDALSFTVMERLSIPSAFVFDRHFAQFTEYDIQVIRRINGSIG